MFLKFGNHKLGDDTGIFNMSSAENCPARLLGMCSVINKGYRCYADKAEIQYGQNVINSRRRQEDIWRSTSSHDLLQLISNQIKRRRKETRYLRFNEAGDFHDQSDISKLSYISRGLRPLGITTYGYTARYDLDFRDVDFLIKGSGHDKCHNGITTVITRDEQVPEGYIICPGSCKRCNLCKIAVPHNIAFIKH